MSESATRRSDRIYVRMAVEIAVNSNGAIMSYAASTLDISNLGARVQTRVLLAPGERVDLIWHDPASRSLPSQVIWSAPARLERGHEVGLQFLQPLPVGA